MYGLECFGCWTIIIIPLKARLDGINVQNVLLKISWNTRKTFHAIHIYFLKREEASKWILYSSLLCLSNNHNIWWYILHRLSRLIKIGLKWIRVPKTDVARQKFRTRRDNKNSSKLSCKARNKPLKCHTKKDPFSSVKFQRIGYSI